MNPYLQPTPGQFKQAAAKFPPTDKARYAKAYTDLFRVLNLASPFTMLELGMGKNAASLHMWQELFTGAAILYGAEIREPFADAGKDVASKVFHCDLSSRQARLNIANTLVELHGSPPLDIVIDDGSHFAKHIHECFTQFFPLVRPGGMYVIEDLETNDRAKYHQGYRPRPVEWINSWSKNLATDQLGPDRSAAYSMHYYKNLVAIIKS